MKDIKIFEKDKLIGEIHIFQDESGTELNEVVEVEGERYHEPLAPFCYISDKQLSEKEIKQFIEDNKESIIKALKEQKGEVRNEAI